ncbi:protein FAM209 [Odocoileus virginianus]|uniref:Protein FAM209 n=1 Tax=Odocoileus virginianus TaxID=9874 RepID=A0A6J0YI68_ODOVR
MARVGSGWGASVTSPRSSPAWSPVSRCKSIAAHCKPHPAASLLTMQSLKWCLFLPLCLSCGYAFMFSSLRDKPKETQGKVPCGGHFRIRQNLPEHTQSWLGSKWLWLIFIVVLYVILKFRGDSEKNKVQTPPTLRGCTFRPPGRKNASLNKDYAFSTLTQLEMDLVKFVPRVHNLKLTIATGGHFRLQNLGGADPHRNVTIYEIWGEEDSAD